MLTICGHEKAISIKHSYNLDRSSQTLSNFSCRTSCPRQNKGRKGSWVKQKWKRKKKEGSVCKNNVMYVSFRHATKIIPLKCAARHKMQPCTYNFSPFQLAGFAGGTNSAFSPKPNFLNDSLSLKNGYFWRKTTRRRSIKFYAFFSSPLFLAWFLGEHLSRVGPPKRERRDDGADSLITAPSHCLLLRGLPVACVVSFLGWGMGNSFFR